MWLTRAFCAAQGGFFFNQSAGLAARLITASALWLCSTEHSSGQRIEKKWARDYRPRHAAIKCFANWARYSRRTWEINPPTCILTAIDSEFSSLSSSLRTTSFFSVRLQSLWRGERTRDGERKRNRLVAWLTHCEHTFMTHCCIWGREAWQKNQHLQLPQFISTCVFILSLVCTPPGITNYNWDSNSIIKPLF